MRILSSKETRDRLSDVLGSVYHTGQPVTVKRKGKPVAVIISPVEYEQWQAQRQQIARQFARAVDKLHQRNKDKTEEEVIADVNRAVDEVRREGRAAEGQ